MQSPNNLLKNRGKLVVISGPSGVGKGTLLKMLSDRYPGQILFSISATTRRPRPGEVDGRDYFFWTRKKFEAAIEAGDFLEWAEYAGNLYGTPRDTVEEWINLGQTVILEIELVGARQIAKNYADALRVFVAPPSMEILEQRLRGREQDAEAAIAKRLARAREEVEAADEFDFTVINNELEVALRQLEKAIFS
ncbi:guanylate kinase [Thalassoporum mexicanum PCC 7367]|uniref:guanylate kinase n=1 Tax=Thalassoporum mexicanum TaxID=3457544 RepID=UPI00029FDCF7|nr:guanylate kinase [Pseudanabaena sp. PCC 7367]AFY71798.1 guanylate kinase [Pseudanabaena sp. PCC 7367]